MDLALQVSKCQECALRKNSKPIPGEGPIPADLMIIGMAPGYEEIKLNRLFVGPSGQKLNSVLQEVGLKRNQIYITNIVKCVNTPGRKLSKTFIKKCSGLWLTKEIELVKPKVIIALGQDASSFFGKKFAVNSYFYNDSCNCWIVVTHHPARLLRTYDDKPHQELKMAFIIAKNLLHQSSSTIVKSNASYVENISIDTLNKLGTLVAIDLETTGLNFLTDSIRAVGVSNGNTSIGFPFNERNKKVFQEWYKDKSFILHNAKFDYKFLKKEGIEIKVHFDTKLAHSVIDRDSPNGLSELALKYLHTNLTKGTIDFNDKSYSGIDAKQLSVYAANDAFMTYKIYEILKPIIDTEYKFVYYSITIPTMLWLADAEFRGIKVDREEIKKELANMKYKLKSIESDINNNPTVKSYLTKKGLDKLNLRSPKQLSELLYDHLHLQCNDKNTSEATLEYLSEKYPQHAFIKQIVEYRHYFKGFRTYLENLLKFSEVDGRVHPDYSQTRTSTYRLACYSPNLQNIPKSAEISKIIRKCFVTTEEYVLLQADFSQAEFRCLGHYCLHGSTYVLTRRGNGRYTISKIVNQKLPIQVKSYDFESDTIEYQKVQGWFKGGIKDWTPRGRKYSTCNWLKIYHKHHEFPLTCTPNHMIFTFNRGWVKAGDLRVGDLLAIDIPEATYEQQQLILGTLLGDGNFSGVSNMWFYSKNKEYFEFKKLALGKLVTSFRLDKRGIWRGHIIAHPVIRQLKKEMVINGVKYPTISALQRLDALGLAIWYCDDGGYDHYRGYNCYIANARITLNETNFINRKFGLHFRYYKNKGIWLTNKSDVYQFMELISKYVPPCMQYKLDPKFRGRFVNPFTYQGKSISPSPVTRIQHVNKKSVMFDIEVCKNHNFFANRVLVSNSRDPNLIKLINEKKDIHRMLASLAYSKEESEISDNERTIAKTITFGIMYGRGARSIAEQFGISVEEAQKIRNLFFETFPEATRWMQKAKEFAKKHGFVKTLTGRKLPLPKIFSKNEEEAAYASRCAVNYPIQSAVADMTNLAGALVHHEFKKQKLDAYLLLNIHDALVIECHESIVDRVRELVIDIMKNRIKEILKLRVDLDVDVKIGKTLDLE